MTSRKCDEGTLLVCGGVLTSLKSGVPRDDSLGGGLAKGCGAQGAGEFWAMKERFELLALVVVHD